MKCKFMPRESVREIHWILMDFSGCRMKGVGFCCFSIFILLSLCLPVVWLEFFCFKLGYWLFLGGRQKRTIDKHKFYPLLILLRLTRDCRVLLASFKHFFNTHLANTRKNIVKLWARLGAIHKLDKAGKERFVIWMKQIRNADFSSFSPTWLIDRTQQNQFPKNFFQTKNKLNFHVRIP